MLIGPYSACPSTLRLTVKAALECDKFEFCQATQISASPHNWILRSRTAFDVFRFMWPIWVSAEAKLFPRKLRFLPKSVVFKNYGFSPAIISVNPIALFRNHFQLCNQLLIENWLESIFVFIVNKARQIEDFPVSHCRFLTFGKVNTIFKFHIDLGRHLHKWNLCDKCPRARDNLSVQNLLLSWMRKLSRLLIRSTT